MKNYPNILLVMGTGRNVGKTLSACNIIQKLSETHQTVGVKISPHFHELNSDLRYLHKSEELVIVEEQNITQKDSSRMLQAGAEKVFYVQVKNENLRDAFNIIFESVQPKQPVVVESGGLYDILEPGLLFFVSGEKPKKQMQFRKGTNVVKVQSNEINFFKWNTIQFTNSKFTRYA
jgi:hypothetical protein